jgi:hypothetical protein
MAKEIHENLRIAISELEYEPMNFNQETAQ